MEVSPVEQTTEPEEINDNKIPLETYDDETDSSQKTQKDKPNTPANSQNKPIARKILKHLWWKF